MEIFFGPTQTSTELLMRTIYRGVTLWMLIIGILLLIIITAATVRYMQYRRAQQHIVLQTKKQQRIILRYKKYIIDAATTQERCKWFIQMLETIQHTGTYQSVDDVLRVCGRSKRDRQALIDSIYTEVPLTAQLEQRMIDFVYKS